MHQNWNTVKNDLNLKTILAFLLDMCWEKTLSFPAHHLCTGCNYQNSWGQSQDTIEQAELKVWIIIFILCPSDVFFFSTSHSAALLLSLCDLISEIKLYIRAVKHVSAEQTTVFREGRGLFHTIPDTSCIVKPVKTKKVKTGNRGINLNEIPIMSQDFTKLQWHSTKKKKIQIVCISAPTLIINTFTFFIWHGNMFLFTVVFHFQLILF